MSLAALLLFAVYALAILVLCRMLHFNRFSEEDAMPSPHVDLMADTLDILQAREHAGIITAQSRRLKVGAILGNAALIGQMQVLLGDGPRFHNARLVNSEFDPELLVMIQPADLEEWERRLATAGFRPASGHGRMREWRGAFFVQLAVISDDALAELCAMASREMHTTGAAA